jgi:transcriptional regulatory protein RtcR
LIWLKDVERRLCLKEALDQIDPFDLVQLVYVVSICSKSRSLSEAGRLLFAKSREQRKSTNNAERLRKYLAHFGLSWDQISD